jgi:hypothetical protein
VSTIWRISIPPRVRGPAAVSPRSGALSMLHGRGQTRSRPC